MANSIYVVEVSAAGRSPVITGDKARTLRDFIRLFTAILNGERARSSALTVRVADGGVKASAAVTFASLADADTVTVNGKVLTAKTSGAVAANHEFNLGASDTAAAANAAALVNASTDAALANIVTATSALGVLTFSAYAAGKGGNAITIATSNGTRAAITGSVSRLASGAAVSTIFTF